MEEKDLWKFLNTWEPKEGFEYDSEGKAHHENIFAVAAKFAGLVATRPERFDPKSKWWENITRVEVLNNLLDSTADRFARMQNDSKPVIADPTEDEWDIWFGITRWVNREHAVGNIEHRTLNFQHRMEGKRASRAGW
jgi:hypothetical protein